MKNVRQTAQHSHISIFKVFLQLWAIPLLLPILCRADDAANVPTEKKERQRIVTVFGNVLDAETGEPVKRFVIQGGRFDPKDPAKATWGYSERRGNSETGRFSTTVRWNMGWTARIVADGYLPQPVILKSPPDGKARVETTVRLVPGRSVHGRVLDHDQKPVIGASVFVVGPTGLNLAKGKAMNSLGDGEDPKAVRVTTDQQGRFEIRVGEAERLAVSSTELDAWTCSLPKDGKQEIIIRLPKPARLVIWYDIEGAGDKEEFFWQLLGHNMTGFQGVSVEQKAAVARRETLVLSGLTPGEYQVARYRTLRSGSMGFGRMLDRHWISLKPGERKVLRFLRPEGAQVKGRVVGLKEAQLSNVMISVSPDPEPKNPAGRFGGWLTLDARVTDENGNFTTERLPPGTYKIKAEGYPPLTPQQQFTSGIIRPRFVAETTLTISEADVAPMIEMTLDDTQKKQPPTK